MKIKLLSSIILGTVSVASLVILSSCNNGPGDTNSQFTKIDCGYTYNTSDANSRQICTETDYKDRYVYVTTSFIVSKAQCWFYSYSQGFPASSWYLNASTKYPETSTSIQNLQIDHIGVFYSFSCNPVPDQGWPHGKGYNGSFGYYCYSWS